MGIEDIIRKIESETEMKIKEILSSAEKEEKNILAQAEKEAEKIKKKIIEMRKEEIANKKYHEITTTKLEAQKKLLAEKQKIIAEVYEEVLKRLKVLSKDGYRKLLKTLILKFASGGEEIIVTGKDKTKIDTNFLQNLNRELQKRGKKTLTLSFSNRDLSGGFILRSPQAEINVSFPLLLRSLREKTEFEVVKILFGNGQQ